MSQQEQKTTSQKKLSYDGELGKAITDFFKFGMIVSCGDAECNLTHGTMCSFEECPEHASLANGVCCRHQEVLDGNLYQQAKKCEDKQWQITHSTLCQSCLQPVEKTDDYFQICYYCSDDFVLKESTRVARDSFYVRQKFYQQQKYNHTH